MKIDDPGSHTVVLVLCALTLARTRWPRTLLERANAKLPLAVA